MSQTAKIRVQFKEESHAALARAFKTLGWTVKQNRTIREWYGRTSNRFAYAAINPGEGRHDFDIGITYDEEGLATFSYDQHGGWVDKTLGPNLSWLKQQYVHETVKDAFLAVGVVDATKQANGDLLLIVEIP